TGHFSMENPGHFSVEINIDMEGSVAKAIRYQQRFFVLRALPDEAVLENPRLSQAWVDHREERDTD
ncbi:hypothetical protein, partial [Sphingobium yanoikuyae]|uniref:hypothetical protein n=1 Tax=Sphingobium yanoikuyae TaxID=13690 RepID=UPI0028AE7DE2